MRLPDALQGALNYLLSDAKQSELFGDAQKISERYRANPSSGSVRVVSTEGQALAYAAARMPATFGAVSAALAHAQSVSQIAPESLLDIGAGPGTAAWAACLRYPSIRDVLLLEPETAMRRAGQMILDASAAPPEALRTARWIDGDVREKELPQADLVIASYSIGELPEGERLQTVQKLFAAAQRMLLVIEPGTPDGYRRLLSIREGLLAQGAYMAAPCPHDGSCPLPPEEWCHFTVRIERSRLHKRIKGGDSPFEDEKYAYAAFLRRRPSLPRPPRILRHPIVRPGNITLSLCAPDGLKNLIVTRKEKNAFRIARKSSAGDTLQTQTEE